MWTERVIGEHIAVTAMPNERHLTTAQRDMAAPELPEPVRSIEPF